MAKILATCFECGDIELHRTDICLRYCIDNQRTELQFNCSQCRQNNIKTVNEKVEFALLMLAVPFVSWGWPEVLSQRNDVATEFSDEEILQLAWSLVTA